MGVRLNNNRVVDPWFIPFFLTVMHGMKIAVHKLRPFFTDRIRSMGEGYVFTGICHFFPQLKGNLPLPRMPDWPHDEDGWGSASWGWVFVCLVRAGWVSGQRGCLVRAKMATAAVSTHLTGMHSCLLFACTSERIMISYTRNVTDFSENFNGKLKNNFS